MDQIKQVAIVGGVHGNEFSGIYLVKQYQQQPEQVRRRSFTTETVWANPALRAMIEAPIGVDDH